MVWTYEQTTGKLCHLTGQVVGIGYGPGLRRIGHVRRRQE